MKKETLVQMFSSIFCKISKNTFSYRIHPVAAYALTIAFRLLNDMKKMLLQMKVKNGVLLWILFTENYLQFHKNKILNSTLKYDLPFAVSMFLLYCLYLLLQAHFYVKITDSSKETWNSNFETRLPQ